MKSYILGFIVMLGLTSSVNANDISKDYWMSQMVKIFPSEMCKDGSYFRHCFAVSASECTQTLENLTKGCMQKYSSQMPTTFNQPDDGRHWGQVVGACAGGNYDSKLASKMVDDPKCKDPSAWQ